MCSELQGKLKFIRNKDVILQWLHEKVEESVEEAESQEEEESQEEGEVRVQEKDETLQEKMMNEFGLAGEESSEMDEPSESEGKRLICINHFKQWCTKFLIFFPISSPPPRFKYLFPT